MRIAWIPLCCAACGSVIAPAQPDPDGGGAPDDASPIDAAVPDATPTFVTDPIDGRWSFVFSSSSTSHLDCSATFEDGQYYVQCPEPPRDLVPGCTQQAYFRMQGTLGEVLEGSWDNVTRNDGPGCTAEHLPGVDQVEPAWAIMGATRTGPKTGEPGFFEAMYGPWHWEVVVSADPDEGFRCDVTFSPAITASRANWAAECCDVRADVAPMCAHSSCTVLHGTLAAAQLDGEVLEEERYSGSGCVAGGYPDPVVQTGSIKSLTATR